MDFSITTNLTDWSFMQIGVYKLIFDNTDKVYIGSSINIEQRYKTHLTSVEQGRASKKRIKTFDLYGKPRLEILQLCDTDSLCILEQKYIKEYDSVNNGFNTRNDSQSRIYT